MLVDKDKLISTRNKKKNNHEKPNQHTPTSLRG